MKPNYPDAARVWQRVMPREQTQPSMQMLMVQLKQDILFLKQRFKSSSSGAEQLIREYTDHYYTLKGIALRTGSRFPGEVSPMAGHSLQVCYDHALQRLSAYQLRISDPAYGPVFRSLAPQAENHCQKILQLSGETARFVTAQ